MLMQPNSVSQAAAEFAKGNYLIALNIYRKLSDQIGVINFRANVWLCQQRLKNNGRRDITNLALSDMRLACVMDEFTFQCYQPECNLLQLTPEHAISELEAFVPDLLFIESAWRGKNDLWNRKIGTLSSELREVLHWCRERHIPTVFWNKEDPIHYATFLTTAQQFDFVFTTDIDCIPRYKAALGHDRVYLLPFACQPSMHNPMALYDRKDAFCFAGAYYVRYPERTKDLENFVLELPKYKPLEIFDRNYDKNDLNFKFPDAYQPFIVGTLPFSEINKAYKGYKYSINLNSIKQSQTMFARRVYELLGSNTITVSNFSRGVRLMFGDLVISSDSGKEIVQRLKSFKFEAEQKLRLAGLRKVLLEHTYSHRLSYIINKALGHQTPIQIPSILVVGVAKTPDECKKLIDSFRRQSHSAKRMLLIVQSACSPIKVEEFKGASIEVLTSLTQANARLAAHSHQMFWLAPMVPSDYYGSNYLLDLALAARFTSASCVGKGAFYQFDTCIELKNAENAYGPLKHLAFRSSAIRLVELLKKNQTNSTWLSDLEHADCELDGIGLDQFNYCRDGHRSPDIKTVAACVDDLELDVGQNCERLIQIAENIDALRWSDSDLPKWSSVRLKELVGISHPQVSFAITEEGLQLCSNLPDGKHDYLYAKDDLPLKSLPSSADIKTHIEATPGLDVSYVFIFLDVKKRKISHVIHNVNRNHSVKVPEGTEFVRFGLRVLGSGTCVIHSLLWGHRDFEQSHIIGRCNNLILTNNYPSYDDLYRNGFVHARAAAYAKHGVKVDVFRLRQSQAVSYHEFQGIDVSTGSDEVLDNQIKNNHYKNILVHFLDDSMWKVLEAYLHSSRIIVWVHGAEIQPWYRRDYNFINEREREKAKGESAKRMAFWRELLSNVPKNLKLVFVSRYFAEEVMEDLGFRLPEESYTIIHNPIDTELFSYEPKPAEQRKRILSIRPYASRKYANDLSVAAILELSNKPFFKDLDFLIIGDGKLFEETLAPLLQFDNVKIERRFLTHPEIAKLHKEYGVFLTPTRMDAQGVSRDEAMSSGLVPVTNAVAAIPEFVDETCGLLTGAEDHIGMASAIEMLYRNPKTFLALSKAAADRVRLQSDADKVVSKELSMLS